VIGEKFDLLTKFSQISCHCVRRAFLTPVDFINPGNQSNGTRPRLEQLKTEKLHPCSCYSAALKLNWGLEANRSSTLPPTIWEERQERAPRPTLANLRWTRVLFRLASEWLQTLIRAHHPICRLHRLSLRARAMQSAGQDAVLLAAQLDVRRLDYPQTSNRLSNMGAFCLCMVILSVEAFYAGKSPFAMEGGGMEAEVSLRQRLNELPESSRYNSAEFWSAPIAPIETPAPASIKVSVRVPARYQDEKHPPELSQHTELYRSQRSFASDRKLITGIAVVLALGLSALVYFFLTSANEKTTTHTAELAPSVPYPPATPAEVAPRAAPAVTTASEAPAVATPSLVPAAAARPHSPPLANSEGASEPVQVFSKVAQGGDVLYLQRPGVNVRSIPSPTGRAVGTAPKGTRFKVTNRQGDWIQVESGRLKGWINAGFLAPSEPR
jgi:hypothetical protein